VKCYEYQKKNSNWDLTCHILIKYCTGMHIKYIWQAYRNKATYKGGRGTLRCFETVSHFLVKLIKITGHNYCFLLTRVPDPGNFGTDPDPFPKKRIRIHTNIYGLLTFWWYWNAKKFKNVSYPVKNLISSHKFLDISRNFVIFRDTKFREKNKNYFTKYEINISRNVAKFRERKFLSTTLITWSAGTNKFNTFRPWSSKIN
jgi:hypothetical protein